MPLLHKFLTTCRGFRRSPVPQAVALLAIALLALPLLARSAAAQYPVIELTLITPRFGQIGTSVDMRVTGGNHLEQIDRLIFSDPRITAEVLMQEPEGEAAEVEAAAEAAEGDKVEPKWGHFRVSIPADLSAGRYEVHAAGAYGISNPRVFSVTDCPVVTFAAVSQQASEPTSLDDHLGPRGSLVVDHQATAARVDYYRLSGLEKQARRVSIDAQRIDSRMIAQLKLIGPDGRVLQTARGGDGIDPSSVTIPAGLSGDYTIAVHDFLFRGGDPHFYGLRVQTEEAGTDSEAAGLVAIEGAFPRWDGLESITVPDAGDASEAQDAHAEPQQITIGDNAEPLVLTPPAVVESAFAPARGDHVFHFDAEEGSRLSIEVLSQRLGQPTDPRLSVERQEIKADGEILWHAVASEDDPPMIGDAAMRLRSKDPVVSFTAPSTATYRIKICNLDTGRSLIDEPRYRLALRAPSPDFRLVAMFAHPHSDPAQSRPRGSQLMRGDTLSIRVLAVRRDGFAGPIELSIPDLPAGLTCQPVQIAANQSEAHLTVLAGDDAAAWAGEVQVIGKAVTGDSEITDRAAAATFIWGSGDGRDFIRLRRSTKLWVSVTEQQQAPLSIRLGSQESASAPVGASVSLPITLTRRDGGDAAVILRPRNLPAGVTAGEVTVAADQSEGTIELKIAADAKPGNYSLWLQGETKVKFKGITQAEPGDLTVFVPSTTANIELTESP